MQKKDTENEHVYHNIPLIFLTCYFPPYSVFKNPR